MKVVSCKNCGAKYQLDDSDDINAFECSSCAGDLEYVDDYPNQSTTSNSQFVDTYRYDNSHSTCAPYGKPEEAKHWRQYPVDNHVLADGPAVRKHRLP